MKILIAVKSCCRDLDAGFHQAIRETWGKDFDWPGDTVNVRFFIGIGDRTTSKNLQDETTLPCPDGYDDLPAKTEEILKWSFLQGYDMTFLCDNDTYIIPDNLNYTTFRNFDYSGRFGPEPVIGTRFSYRDCHEIQHDQCAPWASGGVGYFISRKAAEIVGRDGIEGWAEDLGIAQTLAPYIEKSEITAADLPDFECVSAWHVQRFSVFEHKFYPIFLHEIYRHHTPEKWYLEVAADEFKARELIAKQPKPRIITNDELEARRKSAQAWKAGRR